MIERDLTILQYILIYKRDHDGNSPTVREIMSGTGYRSYQGTVDALTTLEEEGYIKRYGARKRIMVTNGHWTTH